MLPLALGGFPVIFHSHLLQVQGLWGLESFRVPPLYIWKIKIGWWSLAQRISSWPQKTQGLFSPGMSLVEFLSSLHPHSVGLSTVLQRVQDKCSTRLIGEGSDNFPTFLICSPSKADLFNLSEVILYVLILLYFYNVVSSPELSGEGGL